MGKMKVGFDIGGSSMKVAAVQGNGFRVETVRLPEKLVDENGITMPNAFTQFLKQTVKELRLPHGPAALALPANQVICRLVNMPKMNTEQLMMNLPYEFADFIQGAAEQYHCDYAVCEAAEGDAEEGIPMMAAVAAKERLAEYVQMFAQAGFRLKTILPQEMALVNLTQARQGGQSEYFFVDLGQQRTRITAIWRDRVQATRQIALGGLNLDMAVADELGFADVIVFGSSETGTGHRGMHSALENVYEAIVGALYLEGGLEAAAGFVDATLIPRMSADLALEPENPKSALQERLQEDGITPTYELVDTQGPPHDRTFVAEVFAGEQGLATGVGRTKKEAESQAAKSALARLGELLGSLMPDGRSSEQARAEKAQKAAEKAQRKAAKAARQASRDAGAAEGRNGAQGAQADGLQ